MATYDFVFDGLGLRNWCGNSGDNGGGMTSMADLLAKTSGKDAVASPWKTPFPSMDELHRACPGFPQSRELTSGLEAGFMSIKDSLTVVVDPLTQPLSWALNEALWVMQAVPWFVMIPLLMLIAWAVGRSLQLVGLVAFCFGFLAFVDYYDYTMQTLAIIFVCALICVLLGVPIGIAMSRSDRLQRAMIPVLDMLQTLPPFVYLIPLIFLFSVTEPKLYGIAIILYAIVPVIRLTDLGIRLVDPDVTEAADAFGMTKIGRAHV